MLLGQVTGGVKIIDMIVSSPEKRNNLFKKEYDYVTEVTDPEKCVRWWDNLFEEIISENKTIHKNSSKLSISFRKIVFLIGNRLYVKKLKMRKNYLKKIS